MSGYGFVKGDAVIVSDDISGWGANTRRGVVLSVFNDRVKVRFADGRQESWACPYVARDTSRGLCYDCGELFAMNKLVMNANGMHEFESCLPCFNADQVRVAKFGEYVERVNVLAGALNLATGLEWEHESTGGGCDALVTYVVNPSDVDSESPRVAYVMLTCDAQVIDLGRDSFAVLGFYPDATELDEADELAWLGNDEREPLALDEIVDFVGDYLTAWGVK